MKRESATFDIRHNNKLVEAKMMSKANTAGNFKKQKSFNSTEDERIKGEGSFQEEAKDMNIYDLHRAEREAHFEPKMKVFDSKGKIYMISRTVLTEEDKKGGREAEGRGSVSSVRENTCKLGDLDLYTNKKSSKKRFKMSGFLNEGIRKSSHLNNSDSRLKEEKRTFVKQEAEKKEDTKKRIRTELRPKEDLERKANRKRHRRSKTGVISRNFRIREENLKESLGNVLLSDENEEKERRKQENKQIVIKNIKKGSKSKAKKFEILEDEDPNQSKMVYTNSKNVRGKVFDLFAEKGEEDSSEKSAEKKVNVSKKFDSGTNFFIQPGRRSTKDLEKELVVPIPTRESQNFEQLEKRVSGRENLFSEGGSEKEHLLYEKSSKEIDSERNILYHRFNASELKVKRADKQNWLESKKNIPRDKIEINHKGSYSVRVVEELKNFNRDFQLPENKKVERPSERFKKKGKKEGMGKSKDEKIRKMKLKKKRDVENQMRKKRGHKRNVHSEQLTDYFRDIVQKNNYPIQVKQTHQNMTPDISRKNSLNASLQQDSAGETSANKRVDLGNSIDATAESQSNPFQGGDTSHSKHIQISYENIRSSSQLTNVQQLVTPKNDHLKSSFNFEQSLQESRQAALKVDELYQLRSHGKKTIDKKAKKVQKDKSSPQVNSFPNLGRKEVLNSQTPKSKKLQLEQLSNVESEDSRKSSSPSKIVELKRRKKLKKMEKKLINSKSVFLEDNDQNKYGSNRAKKRQINFYNPEDETDIQFMKNKKSERRDIETFLQRNQQEVKKFKEEHSQLTPKKSLNSELRIVGKVSRRQDSERQSNKDLPVPMQTKEMLPQSRRETASKGSTNRQSKGSSIRRIANNTRNSSNGGSFGHPSFGQASRNSKMSINVTHKSNRNSEVNNNIVVTHSLQNSGIHSLNVGHQNIFKIESPEINSGNMSPEHVEAESPLENNLDDLRTMNKKNITFNPNENEEKKMLNDEDLTPKTKENCLDVEIPRIRSSFEDSMDSFHSEDFVKDASEQQITENTFGYGMEAVIKQVAPKNVFADSLSSFGPKKDKQVPSGRISIKATVLNAELSDPKSISQNSGNISKHAKRASTNNHTEFYYEREHFGNGDSSYKFSNSDNSSRLKNVTPTSHSRDYLRSSNPDSLEVGSRRRSKFMRDVLRGKLNSPVRKIVEISEEKEPFASEKKEEPQRNDNKISIKEDVRNVEHMRNSEMVNLKKKHSRKKRTQLYDNKSAMMMLERSKNISEQNSPVRQKTTLQTSESRQNKPQRPSKLYKQKRQVLVMKSKRNMNERPKHIDFVNVSHERSTMGEKSRESQSRRGKREATLSRECSKKNSVSRQTRKKQSTVDKKGSRKKAVAKLKKGKKKRETKKDADAKGSKSSSRVKMRESNRIQSRNVSRNKQKVESKKNSQMNHLQVKAGKKEKAKLKSNLNVKAKLKESEKKRKHGPSSTQSK